ncbi:PE family protein, partial [Mycobacterium sp.]|uniref:PE family protein n=1 Tax=Mycobacterium sp. TaxID=1785 RepID=UPI003C70E527
MTFVIAAPEKIASAASDLSGIRSMIAAADAAAANSTITVIAAAGDEVSAAIASLFSSHGQAYQSISAQAAAFNRQFVQALHGAGFSYADAEAAAAASLQTAGHDLLGVINAPTDAVLG